MIRFHPAGASPYIHRIAARTAGRLWWLWLLPITLAAYGLAADWRWVLVGLMLAFIAYPMVMVLALMAHAARPQVAARADAGAYILYGDTIVLIPQKYTGAPHFCTAPRICSNWQGMIYLPALGQRDTVYHRQVDGSWMVLNTGNSPSDFILIPLRNYIPVRC